MIDNFDDDTNFPRELLLTNRQAANLRKALANYSSTDKYNQENIFVDFLVNY